MTGSPGWALLSPGTQAKDREVRQGANIISVRTSGRGLIEVTREVAEWTSARAIDIGLLTVFCRHTSASLLIQENASADVRTDLETFFGEIAPEDAARYHHRDEGPDDMPAHIRSALTGAHLSIPVIGGRLALGTWQGLYLFEHRRRPHLRELALHVIGA
jgi:secondary thiamine-phosphate synthase enzyme